MIANPSPYTAGTLTNYPGDFIVIVTLDRGTQVTGMNNAPNPYRTSTTYYEQEYPQEFYARREADRHHAFNEMMREFKKEAAAAKLRWCDRPVWDHPPRPPRPQAAQHVVARFWLRSRATKKQRRPVRARRRLRTWER